MRIFLSHASQDKGTAESIAFSLRSRGHKVFLDRDDLPAGQSYDEQIGRAVKKSRIFIFLISPDSVAVGRYTLTELTFARRKWNDPNGRVLPVMVRKTPLEDIPSYLKAVTILEPIGNLTAETSAAVDDMRHGGPLAWRFAAELSARYRYVLALGAFCAIAVVLAFVLSGGDSDNNQGVQRISSKDDTLPGPSAKTVQATPLNCKEERNLRSLEGTVKTSIVFTNKEDQPIRVYWLDYDGKRIPYGTLERDQVFSAATFLTHPWLITDAKDQCKAIYMPASQRLEITVAG